jgi:hypothetical protein
LITPEEIVRKATLLYPSAITAWLTGDTTYFPRRIPTNLRITKGVSQAELIAQVTRLRDRSKETMGSGYCVRYEQVNKRAYGENRYPTAIELETFDDLLKLVGKRAEFTTLETAIEKLRRSLPELESWWIANWKRLLGVADSLDDLIQVTRYVIEHPRPNCYLRELPLAVSSKLIERNKPLLREWFDLLLPPHAIEHGVAPKQFERRYGFRYPRQHLLVRLLDPQLQSPLGLRCSELSLPAEEIAELPIHDVQVIIVENKINLLTLPGRERTLALGGLGNNLSEFEQIPWLSRVPVYYWGDIDVAGLTILARLRHKLPHVVSFLMDAATLLAHRELWTKESTDPHQVVPMELRSQEAEAFCLCRDQAIRLEQEHLPQGWVNSAIPRDMPCDGW